MADFPDSENFGRTNITEVIIITRKATACKIPQTDFSRFAFPQKYGRNEENRHVTNYIIRRADDNAG